jgi:hypothetical protein
LQYVVVGTATGAAPQPPVPQLPCFHHENQLWLNQRCRCGMQVLDVVGWRQVTG